MFNNGLINLNAVFLSIIVFRFYPSVD